MLVQAKQASTVTRFVFPAPRAHAPRAVVCKQENSFSASLELMGTKFPYVRNEEIYGQGESSEYLYKIISGSVRTYKLLDDGRRQIGAFYLPGDVFGLESGAEHRFSAEAISDAVVIAVKRSTLNALSQSDPVIARELWQITARELDHVHDLMVLLGRSNARERVAAFLMKMAKDTHSAVEIELPMSRQDIADYLGLTIETISRTLSCMERDAIIALPSSRKILLRNRVALRKLNS
jgi:CRP/FNR family nitrogen fixation transcriptional regulator